MTPTVVHLFCGAGGGGLGFARAGFHSLAAINCKATLTAAADGFALSSEAIWVHEGRELAT